MLFNFFHLAIFLSPQMYALQQGLWSFPSNLSSLLHQHRLIGSMEYRFLGLFPLSSLHYRSSYRVANWSQQTTVKTFAYLVLKINLRFYLCSFGLMFLSTIQTLPLVIKDSEIRSADVKSNSFLIRCFYFFSLIRQILFASCYFFF